MLRWGGMWQAAFRISLLSLFLFRRLPDVGCGLGRDTVCFEREKRSRYQRGIGGDVFRIDCTELAEI